MSNNTNESSLTSPEDRDLIDKWRPDQSDKKLTDDEAVFAIKELNNQSYTDKFPKIEKSYADPVILEQKYGLISFIPAKGATPNEKGVYGFAKLRGNYSTQIEAVERAEYLIRNIDSYHQIFHTYVGRPFPLTLDSKFSAETCEVDIRKEITKAVSTDIKDKKDEERKVMSEIKEREEKLKEDVKIEEADPYDEYITLCVKKAQLSWTFTQHYEKMCEIKDIIVKTREELTKLDKEHPDFRDSYFKKYMDARNEAGLKEESEDEKKKNFISFMVEEKPLPYIDFIPETFFPSAEGDEETKA